MTTPAQHNAMVLAISSLRSPAVVAMAFRGWRDHATRIRRQRLTLRRCIMSWRVRALARGFRTWHRVVFVSQVVAVLNRVVSRWASTSLSAAFFRWRANASSVPKDGSPAREDVVVRPPDGSSTPEVREVDVVRRPDGTVLQLNGSTLMQLRSVIRLLERTITSSSAAEWMVPAPASMSPGGGRLGGGGPTPSRREMERDLALVKAMLQARMAAGETL